MTRSLLLLAVLLHSGCAGALVYAESRKVTREGIIPPLATLAPGVPTEGAADCVMKGLTQGEVISLPNSGTLDDPSRASAFVQGVLARPDVGACVANLPKTAA